MVKKATPTQTNPAPKEPQLFEQRGLVGLSLRLTAEMIEDLRVEAFHQRTNKSEIVRRAITEYLENHK
jgi:hypothetical protein